MTPSRCEPTLKMEGRPLERLLIRHRWLEKLAYGLGYLGFTALVWPRFFAPFRWRLVRHPMVLPGLAASFQGYRILQLSDLHVGRADLAYLRRAILDALAQSKPDLVVVTGDFIDYQPRSLALLESLLPVIEAPDGVVGILGNHDYHEYSRGRSGRLSAQRSIHKRLIKLLARHQIQLLRNERLVIQRPGGGLQIVGLDEKWVGRADPEKAFSRVDPQSPCICLQHNPDGYLWLKDYPWHWMLCGHSHGGQVDLPLLGPMYLPMEQRDWFRGLYHLGDRKVYVSSGLGYSHPFRMRVPPEITLFELEAG